MLPRNDLTEADRVFHTPLLCQADIDYLRSTLSQLEVDSTLMKAVSLFLVELGEALPHQAGKKLATCLSRATARLAATNKRIAANLERILPTGPKRKNKVGWLLGEFEDCHKALLLRAFYDL